MSRSVHCPKHYYSPGELSESDPAVPATPHLSVGWSALNQTDHKSYPGTLLHCLFVISRQSKQCKRVPGYDLRSEEHTSELQSRGHHVFRLLLKTNNGRH